MTHSSSCCRPNCASIPPLCADMTTATASSTLTRSLSLSRAPNPTCSTLLATSSECCRKRWRSRCQCAFNNVYYIYERIYIYIYIRVAVGAALRLSLPSIESFIQYFIHSFVWLGCFCWRFSWSASQTRSFSFNERGIALLLFFYIFFTFFFTYFCIYLILFYCIFVVVALRTMRSCWIKVNYLSFIFYSFYLLPTIFCDFA